MKWRSGWRGAASVVGLLLIAVGRASGAQAASEEATPEKGAPSALLAEARELFARLPEKMPDSENDTKARIELGRKLYFEAALSSNRTQSCNTCHRLDEKLGGVDNLPTSKGAEGQLGTRNSPTTLNAGLHVAQFWDGRAADLAAQAKGPVLNPIEMTMSSEEEVLARLEESGYREAFQAAFPESATPLSFDNFAEAVAAFERTLLTRDRFDDFLGGKTNALTAAEADGLKRFIETGCADCHGGVLLGGESYEKMGQANEYANKKDLGRFDVTGDEEDRYVFKVPSLRNIALTHPYYHDGQSATLADAVKQMAWLQLGEELGDEEVRSIVRFLGSLTDKERAAK